MNTLEMKGHLLAPVLALVATGSIAQTASVSFSGMVVGATCAVAVSGAAVSNHATAIALPPVNAYQTNLTDNISGKTIFSLGMTSCSATSPVTPLISITSRQAVGGYIASGIKNLVIELGKESKKDEQKSSVALVVPQIPGATKESVQDTIQNDFYIQYRAVVGDAGSDDAVVPTITVNLIYL